MIYISDHERMHVLYLPRWYPNRYDPMPGLFIQRHGLAASAFANVSVLYVHPDNDDQHVRYRLDISKEDGLFTVAVYIKRNKFPIRCIANIIKQFQYVRAHRIGLQKITDYRRTPDLVHVHVLTRLGILAWMYKFFTGVPYVITEHWTRYLNSRNNFNGFWRKRISKMVIKRAKAVMPVSEDLKLAMQSHKLNNKNYQIIPNVVDTEVFQPLAYKKAEKIKHFVHLSCFTDSQKNISGILNVLKKLAEQRSDFECSFIGDGPDFLMLKNLAKDLGIEKHIHFSGLLEGKKLADKLREADAMIMFSWHENLPVVILESYACGIPVISSNVGGIHEHMNKDLGRLVEKGDEDQLLQKLNEFLDEPETYDKSKIRKYAEKHFSKRVIGKQLFEVYKSAINKRKFDE